MLLLLLLLGFLLLHLLDLFPIFDVLFDSRFDLKILLRDSEGRWT